MIKDPAMRLWIAEVVGIDHETMSAALLNSVIALLKVIENMPVIQVNKSVINSKICAAIREKIPFDVVKDALDKRQKELKIKRQRFKRKCIVSMNP
jgi:hypothetical protein